MPPATAGASAGSPPYQQPISPSAAARSWPARRERASLVAAHLIGVAMLRHVLRVEPLAGATREEIIALMTPAIEQYLR
jgi:Tetracyclin repressor-like, C-terminal domain